MSGEEEGPMVHWNSSRLESAEATRPITVEDLENIKASIARDTISVNDVLKESYGDAIRDTLNCPITFSGVTKEWEAAPRWKRAWWRAGLVVRRVRHRLGHWILGGECFWCGGDGQD